MIATLIMAAAMATAAFTAPPIYNQVLSGDHAPGANGGRIEAPCRHGILALMVRWRRLKT